MKRSTVGLVILLFAWSLTAHGKYSATGDEPHFLMVTESLVADHDIDVANNYARNDGRLFGHNGLEMGNHAIRARNGRILPAHDIGLSVALVPAYIVARTLAKIPPNALLTRARTTRGLLVYSIIGLFLIALTAWALVLLADGIATLVSSRAAGWLVIAAGISPPIVSHSFLVFPEVIALVVTALAVWFCLKLGEEHDRVRSLWIIFALGMLPWLHHKYLLYVFGLAFLIAWERRSLFRTFRWTDWVLATLLFGLPQLALHLWTWHEWGTFTGALTTNDVPLSWAAFKVGAVALWMDRQQGLLAYAPIYWIVPACWMLSSKRTWPYAVPALLLYVPAAAFTHGWWAGFSPAARYIVPLMPLFLLVMARALAYPAIRVTLIGLALWQVAIDAIVWQFPRTLWPAASGVNEALQRMGTPGRTYATLLPKAQAGDSIVPALLVLIAVSIALVLAARPWRPTRSADSSPATRSAGL